MLRVDWKEGQELGGLCCAQLCAFLPQLVSVLREVSYLQGSGAGAIPLAAAEVYSCKESFQQLVASLELMGNRYNKVLRTVLEVEYPLVQGQLQDIDLKLREAEETLTWKMEGELALCDTRVSSCSPVCPVSLLPGSQWQFPAGQGTLWCAQPWGGEEQLLACLLFSTFPWGWGQDPAPLRFSPCSGKERLWWSLLWLIGEGER